MSITVKEIRRSRSHVSGANPTARREYLAWGSADGDAIELAVLAVAPDTVGPCAFDQIACEPNEKHEEVWDVVLSYAKVARKEPPATNDEEISFDLGSQTIKVKRSLGTVDVWFDDEAIDDAPDFSGGIGWNSDKKEFDGADKMIEQFSFSITKYIPATTVEAVGYMQTLRNAAFTTNDAEFRGFAIGEVLFIGASGNKRNADDYAITFKFLVSKNGTGLTVGGLEDIDKAGWDYLWELEEKSHDDDEAFVVAKTLAAYVEQIYGSSDFVESLGLTA